MTIHPFCPWDMSKLAQPFNCIKENGMDASFTNQKPIDVQENQQYSRGMDNLPTPARCRETTVSRRKAESENECCFLHALQWLHKRLTLQSHVCHETHQQHWTRPLPSFLVSICSKQHLFFTGLFQDYGDSNALMNTRDLSLSKSYKH